MVSFQYLKVLLLCHLIWCPVVNLMPSAITRIVPFDDFRKGQKLTTEPLKVFKKISTTSCLQFCSKTSQCLSVSICFGGVCQINSGDAFSIGVSLIPSDSCDYVGMKRNEAPRCREERKERNIRDDSEPNKCEINEKRVDSVCGEWSDLIINRDIHDKIPLEK